MKTSLYRPVSVRVFLGTDCYSKKVAYNNCPYYFYIETVKSKETNNLSKYNIYLSDFDGFYLKNCRDSKKEYIGTIDYSANIDTFLKKYLEKTINK